VAPASTGPSQVVGAHTLNESGEQQLAADAWQSGLPTQTIVGAAVVKPTLVSWDASPEASGLYGRASSAIGDCAPSDATLELWHAVGRIAPQTTREIAARRRGVDDIEAKARRGKTIHVPCRSSSLSRDFDTHATSSGLPVLGRRAL
jgi:hypothetical protein